MSHVGDTALGGQSVQVQVVRWLSAMALWWRYVGTSYVRRYHLSNLRIILVYRTARLIFAKFSIMQNKNFNSH
eukprot:COSAG01_NODE_10906_length_2054_cov_3.956522_3_plen_73_part_00